MSKITNGQKAPTFSVNDNNGNLVKLSDFEGKNLVLYFYPKDDTPGCTKEACSFRDSFSEFRNKNIEIRNKKLINLTSKKRAAILFVSKGELIHASTKQNILLIHFC